MNWKWVNSQEWVINFSHIDFRVKSPLLMNSSGVGKVVEPKSTGLTLWWFHLSVWPWTMLWHQFAWEKNPIHCFVRHIFYDKSWHLSKIKHGDDWKINHIAKYGGLKLPYSMTGVWICCCCAPPTATQKCFRVPTLRRRVWLGEDRWCHERLGKETVDINTSMFITATLLL